MKTLIETRRQRKEGAPLTEASLRLRVTDLLLGGLRDVQLGRLA